MKASNVAWLKIYLSKEHQQAYGERKIVMELRSANNKNFESRYYYPDKSTNHPLSWEQFEREIRNLLLGAAGEKYAPGKRLTIDIQISGGDGALVVNTR